MSGRAPLPVAGMPTFHARRRVLPLCTVMAISPYVASPHVDVGLDKLTERYGNIHLPLLSITGGARRPSRIDQSPRRPVSGRRAMQYNGSGGRQS